MKKNKTLKTVIIILIILIVLAGGAFAYIYFGTDLLKSNKELFGKYATQLGDGEAGFSPTILTNYENKKSTTSYSNSGRFSVNTVLLGDAATSSTGQSISPLLDTANGTNITFSGSVDNANRRVEENISVNYSDSVTLPFTYKQDGDTYGIQADIFTPNYIAVQNDNLQQLLQNLGATDIQGIPNKIELSTIESLQFTDEERTQLYNTYILSVYNNLGEEKFTKAQGNNGENNYTLTLTTEEFKNIMVQTLQTLSNDTATLNKINSILQEVYGDTTTQITAEDINELANNLSSQTAEAGNITITLTEQDGVTTGITINTLTLTIEITKNQTDSMVAYNFAITSTEGQNVSLAMTYEGLNTDNVAENISFILDNQNGVNVTYAYSNNVSFGNVASIEGFDSNTVILNNYSAEQLQPFVVQLVAILMQTNSDQMNELGFPEEIGNPMMMWFVTPTLFQSTVSEPESELSTDMGGTSTGVNTTGGNEVGENVIETNTTNTETSSNIVEANGIVVQENNLN